MTKAMGMDRITVPAGDMVLPRLPVGIVASVQGNVG